MITKGQRVRVKANAFRNEEEFSDIDVSELNGQEGEVMNDGQIIVKVKFSDEFAKGWGCNPVHIPVNKLEIIPPTGPEELISREVEYVELQVVGEGDETHEALHFLVKRDPEDEEQNREQWIVVYLPPGLTFNYNNQIEPFDHPEAYKG